MHQDLEKLINITRESGELTEKQKEIILRKARTMGEDLDEVEMVLETIMQKQKINSSKDATLSRRRCPNCGTIVSGYVLQCPECGYLFHKESMAVKEARDYIKGLSDDLMSIEKRMDLDETEKENMKATAINSFTVPNTIEALIQLFSLSYSNYTAEKQIVNSTLAPVWLGKAKSTYLLLKSQPGIDDKTKCLIDNYSFVEDLIFSERIQKKEKEKYEIVKEKENTRRFVAEQQKEQSNEKWLYIMCAIMMLAVALMMIFYPS